MFRVIRKLALAAAALVLLSGCTSASRPHALSTPSAGASATSRVASKPPALSVVLPRIEAFVEKERGLKFKHSVKVTLLAEKAFLAKLKSMDKSSATDEEKTKATLAALGLIKASTDLHAAFTTATDAGVIGFYDDKTKALYVRGATATPGTQAVLSHELTHALTDQWFGLNRPALDKDTQEKSLGFTTLIEGDAERTRMAFEATLSAADRASAQKQENAGGTPKVPQIVLELISLPYAIGPQFVESLVIHDGLSELNRAYRNPPVSSEQLLEPTKYFAGQGPETVAKPRADGKVLDASDLGEIGLILMLSSRIDQQTAVQASRGWGGDEYVSWKSGSRYCIRDSVEMDDAAASAQLHDALSQWVDDSHGTATIESSGQVTTFKSCSS
jgi:hypothetical protein